MNTCYLFVIVHTQRCYDAPLTNTALAFGTTDCCLFNQIYWEGVKSLEYRSIRQKWDKNLEWQRGRNGGWCLIGCPMNDKLEDETFPIGPMIIDLIAETKQNLYVDIILDDKVASV